MRTINDLNNNNNNISFKEKAVNYINNIPLFVKFIIFCTVLFYILSFFSDIFIYLINIPYFTIFELRIWTIITTVFITTNIINILFAFISWIPSAIDYEKENGTVNFILYFFTHSIIIQLLFILISLIIQSKTPSLGLWPYIIFHITITCMKNPESNMMFFFFPWPIKSKYYPLVLIMFFFLINGGKIQLDFIISVIYGYCNHFLINSKLEYSSSFILKVENSFVFKYIKLIKGFIHSSNLTLNPQELNTNTIEKQIQNKQTAPFSGKGVAIGSSGGPIRIPGSNDIIDVSSGNNEEKNKYYSLNETTS